MSAPVCLIEGGADGLRVTEDGVRCVPHDLQHFARMVQLERLP